MGAVGLPIRKGSHTSTVRECAPGRVEIHRQVGINFHALRIINHVTVIDTGTIAIDTGNRLMNLPYRYQVSYRIVFKFVCIYRYPTGTLPDIPYLYQNTIPYTGMLTCIVHYIYIPVPVPEYSYPYRYIYYIYRYLESVSRAPIPAERVGRALPAL